MLAYRCNTSLGDSEKPGHYSRRDDEHHFRCLSQAYNRASALAGTPRAAAEAGACHGGLAALPDLYFNRANVLRYLQQHNAAAR